VVAKERNRERQSADVVGGREVVHPEERLSAKLDSVWEEGEHSDKYGPLEEHRYATREWASAGFRVEFHSLLLALHSVFLAGVFIVEFFNFGSEHTHLSLRFVAFESEGESYDLDEDSKEQDNDAVVADETAEEVKDWDNDESVNPTEDAPSERNEFSKVEVFVDTVSGKFLKLFVEAREKGIVVGAEEESERGRIVYLRRVVESSVHAQVFESSFAFNNFAVEVGSVEFVVSDDNRREELVFESDPADAAGELFVVVACRAKIVGVLVVKFVVNSRVTFFESVSDFVALHGFVPF
jgi:hypothetical protein